MTTVDYSELVQKYKLSPREIEFRDSFVAEYLKDGDAFKACIRVGYPSAIALEYSQKLMEDEYVLNRLMQLRSSGTDNQKVEDAETKRLIRAQLLREAQYIGPGSSHAARVSALAKLMSMYGMDAPITSKSEIIHRGGVMAVPEIADIDAWEKAAMALQEKLADDVVH